MKVRCPNCHGLGTTGPFPVLACWLCKGWGFIRLTADRPARRQAGA